MKKITLAISSPCHESWDAMTPEQKGRFCAACQKTVVDFTGMSDGQIATFFQKPTTSVCGRFYNDQLNRPILSPGKKVSLPKHFFRYTWPAFLLLLKSCAQKEDERYETLIGVVLETQMSSEMPQNTHSLPQIIAADFGAVTFYPPMPIECTSVDIDRNVLQGDTIMTVQNNVKDESLEGVDSSFAAVDSSWVDADAMKITAYPGNEAVLMGEVVVTHDTKQTDNKAAGVKEVPGSDEEKPGLTIYPNPVPKGQPIHLQFTQAFSGTYQLHAMSGQVVRTGKIAVDKNQRFTVPAFDIAAGTYVLQLLNEKTKSVVTGKFIVQ